MEILFPAGCMEYVIAANECGANAVYGGLKLWNARNKATNFSIEQMQEAIEFCHSHNMKFYMTLNTLLFDNEIEEIISTLKQFKILPDAFICADLGLINVLKENFPSTEIHISTQFGIQSVSDLKYLESLGVSRVILAREMSDKEIIELKNSTKLEVEVFVWGTQCLSFSGSCFLGSLCNGGTANRGKCITMCRNKYLANNTISNLFYVSDLYCLDYVNYIFPIDSLKIEGRRRDTKELKAVVDEIKNHRLSKENNGFIIGSDMLKNKLYEKINSRQKVKFQFDKNLNYDNNDVWVDIENGNYLNYTSSPSLSSYYLCTEIKSSFKPNMFNISLEIEQNNGYTSKVMLLNAKGEAKYFYNTNENKKNITLIDEFIENLREIKQINLYYAKYKKEHQDEKVYISNETADEIKNYILQLYPNKKSLPTSSTKIENIIVEVTDKNIAKQLSSAGIKTILNLATNTDLEKLDVLDYGDNVYFKLPFFNFENKDLLQLCKKLENRNVVFTKMSQIYLLKDLTFKNKISDYLVPVWNTKSKEILKSFGVTKFCSSPELSIKKNRMLFKDEKVIHLLAGNPACAFTRICFKNALDCITCNGNLKKIKNCDNEMDFLIKCHTDHRTIHYKNKILNCYEKTLPNECFRYVSIDESFDEIMTNIVCFKQKNYYETLCKKWKNCFQNSLWEDK